MTITPTYNGIFSVLIFGLIVVLPINNIDANDSLSNKVLDQHFQTASTYFNNKEYRKAYQEGEKVLKLILKNKNASEERSIELHNFLGDCALENSLFQLALEHYQKAVSITEINKLKYDTLAADAYNKLGHYYQETKSYQKALNFFNKALDIRIVKLGKWHLKTADTYDNLGINFNFSGDLDKALDFHTQALLIRKKQLGPQNKFLAQSFNNIALCYNDQGLYEKAINYFNRAINIYQSNNDLYGRELGDVYLNIANAYGLSNDFKKAINLQYKALDIGLRIYGKNHLFVADVYNNLGNAYDQLDYISKAENYFSRSLFIRHLHFGDIHPDVAAVHYNMALSFFWNKKFANALESFNLCLISLNYKLDQSNEFSTVNDLPLLFSAIQMMAEVYKAKYTQNTKLEVLIQAFRLYEISDRLLDYLIKQYDTKGSKLQLAELGQLLYDNAIEVALLLKELTNNENYIKQAFLFSEKSKSILLREGMRISKAKKFSGVPDSIIQQLEAIDEEIASLEKLKFLLLEKNAESNLPKIDSAEVLLFNQKQQKSILTQKIEKEYPRFYNLKYATSTVSIQWLQKYFLQKDQTIVEYFLGTNYIRVFIINKDKIDVISLNRTENFNRSLDTFNQTVTNFIYTPQKKLEHNLNQYIFSAVQLYKTLVKPIDSLLQNRIIIIPHGKIAKISFEALLKSIPTSLKAFRQYPFLLNDKAISYNYSSGLLKEMFTNPISENLKNYLGIAPVFTEHNSEGLDSLTYNEKEIRDVQNKIGGMILVGKKADKNQFIRMHDQFKILHLATHAKVNDQSEDFSYLAFSETGPSANKASLLYTKEIYTLNTKASLVVLSACETGTGQIKIGEGVMSISRAFSYAGSKSLLSSKWLVDDKATQQLINAFFTFLKEGYPKDLALQKAKHNFIERNPQLNAHPFYWASFNLIGNTNPIGLKNKNKNWWVIPSLLMASMILLWLRKRTRQKIDKAIFYD